MNEDKASAAQARQAPPQQPQRRPAPRQSPPVPHRAPCEADCRCGDLGLPWWAEVPGRVLRYLWALTLPLRAAVWALEAAVAAAVVGTIAVGWAWWTQRITDEQVAKVLGELGARGLSILNKSGIL